MKENIPNKNLSRFGFISHSYLKIFAVCCLSVMVSCKVKKQLVASKAAGKRYGSCRKTCRY